MRRAQAETTKAKIYRVATKMISKKGYNNVTIQEICSLAGVSVGSFYHHFKAKEGILMERYDETDRYFDEVFAAYPEDANAVDLIIDFIGHQMYLAKSVQIDLVTPTYFNPHLANNAFFRTPERSIPKHLRKIVENGQAKGQIRPDISAKEISTYILRFSRGMIYDWCIKDGDYDIRKAGREAVGFLVNHCFAVSKEPLKRIGPSGSSFTGAKPAGRARKKAG
jgi:AcrR family transcriptional regulator